MAKRHSNTAEKALHAFQRECQNEGLGLECALAQLALFALRLEAAHREDSWQRTWTQLYHVRDEARNVLHALREEYPDMDWSQEQQPEKP